MNKGIKIAAALCVLALAIFFSKDKLNMFTDRTDADVLSIQRSTQSFSKSRYSFEPGEKVSLKFFNGLTDQSVAFYILNEGEDPTLVQHLSLQQGGLPEEYFYFKGDKILPKTEVTIDFTAPSEEGDYYFVGIGDMPIEGLYGKLSIKSIQGLTDKTTNNIVE